MFNAASQEAAVPSVTSLWAHLPECECKAVPAKEMKDGCFVFVRRVGVARAPVLMEPCAVCPPWLQENCRSPSQNHKAKDATSDSSKGQTLSSLSLLFCSVLFLEPDSPSSLPPLRRRRGLRCPPEERVAGGRNRVRPGPSHGRPAPRRLPSRFPQSV